MGTQPSTTIMNMKSAASLAVMACALESATAFFAATGVAAGLTTLEITGLGAGTTLTAGATSAALLTGGVLLLKGLAIAGLAIAASQRHRREALAVEEQDAAFAVLAANEPAKFEFVTAAKIGKKHKSVQTCELRYSCPLSG